MSGGTTRFLLQRRVRVRAFRLAGWATRDNTLALPADDERPVSLIETQEDVLYVHDANIITSAGSSAAIDASLHVIRCDHGSAIANKIARSLVAPLIGMEASPNMLKPRYRNG